MILPGDHRQDGSAVLTVAAFIRQCELLAPGQHVPDGYGLVGPGCLSDDGAQEVGHSRVAGRQSDRPIPLLSRVTSLPHGHQRTAYDRQQSERANADGHSVSRDESAEVIPVTVRARADRNPVEMIEDVLLECINRKVALLWPLLERLEDDGVQVAGQGPAQLVLRRGAGPSYGFRYRRLARPRRLLRQDRFFDRRGRRALQSIRALPGQQLIQHHAQGVDVRTDAQSLAGDLFRGGVLRRQHATRKLRQPIRALGVAQQFRDAEIQQHHATLRCHEDVRRFEIPVDDELGVGKLHCFEHLQEHSQALADREAGGVAMGVQRRPGDILHGQVRLTRFGDASVVETRDIRVAECREDVAFAGESFGELQIPQSDVRQLQGELALDLSVAAFGEPDDTRTAVADLPKQPVGADYCSGLIR